jgi:hypothetical protein
LLDSVLRVFSSQFDVDDFLNTSPINVPVQIFRKGEPDLFGSPNLESGFDALLSEEVDPALHIAEIQTFLSTHPALFAQLNELNVSCVLDLGWTVGNDGQFTQALMLSVDFLGLCHQLNIAIEFAAYPEQADDLE